MIASPMRVVVIGSAGFVGGALISELQKQGLPYVGITRKDLDLTDKDAAKKLGSILDSRDRVIAAAAIAPCKTNHELVANMKIAQAIVEAAKTACVEHVINVGSDAIYADTLEFIDEKSPIGPDSIHGAMHLAREMMFKSIGNTPLLLLRPTLLYGANDPHNGYGPNQFIRLTESKKDIVLFGEGEEMRDHVYIEDLAKVTIEMVKRKCYGTLNIVSGQVYSFKEIAENIIRVANSQNKIISQPRTQPMPHQGMRKFRQLKLNDMYEGFEYTNIVDGLLNVWKQKNSK